MSRKGAKTQRRMKLALWVKAVVVPLEVLQRKLFIELAGKGAAK